MKLKKSLGQNFLTDSFFLEKIIQSSQIQKLDDVIEIGPGDGKLTEKIVSKNPSKLTLIEIDKDLIKNLKERYSGNKKIEVINEDILKIDVKKKYQLVISNLPYNISSQILIKLSLLDFAPDMLILMFQKEFAHRLLDKKLNSINSLVRCFYDIKLNFNLSKNCFRPIPKVDSSVLTFKKIKKRLLKKNEVNEFIIFKRKLFSHKRKSLRNILKKYNLKNNFNLNLRVENLKLEELIRLFRAVSYEIYQQN